MDAYLFPIKIAVLLFPILAFVLTLPFAIYQYRKFGGLNFLRNVVLYTFIFYLLCAFLLILLPLPDPDDVAKMTGSAVQLIPFKFVQDFLAHTVIVWNDPSTYLVGLTQAVVLQPIFNILLVIPFGIYLRYYFRFSFRKTILFSFLLSLFFEVTQLTGIYGIYPHAYRLFDVDDLGLNTLGGIVGYAIAPLFTSLLPSRSKMDEITYLKGKRVSYIRRLLAFIVDWFLLDVLTWILGTARVIPFKKLEINGGTGFSQLWWLVLLVFLYFIVIPRFARGQTIGKGLVRIQIKSTNSENLTFKHLFIRNALLYYVALATIILPQNPFFIDRLSPVLFLTVIGIGFVAGFMFFIHICINVFSKDRQLFYEKLSHTAHVSTFKPKKSDL
ncbi:VanZ/RDD domain-containing protein [Listeria weihenstephanensis FSL R9-0317]|uniref:Uncharacterized protein n=1 Tax=Listeria weihenstephanensis TaxID=1006155 RepID=A0A1S7FT47_9LIST|nr:VanZ family protein [Listeria weihenstephanensis]AQY50570.1 hypothetical protein UE46_05680 [Listeria weihenstephanensis]EUJ38937.1 VanZ/RDD domain-containing protein [Listeria weihenstephanensis FSL R9-0317]